MSIFSPFNECKECLSRCSKCNSVIVSFFHCRENVFVWLGDEVLRVIQKMRIPGTIGGLLESEQAENEAVSEDFEYRCRFWMSLWNLRDWFEGGHISNRWGVPVKELCQVSTVLSQICSVGAQRTKHRWLKTNGFQISQNRLKAVLTVMISDNQALNDHQRDSGGFRSRWIDGSQLWLQHLAMAMPSATRPVASLSLSLSLERERTQAQTWYKTKTQKAH